MSDVERIAQIQARDRVNPPGSWVSGPDWAFHALEDRAFLLAALARRDAAIQAVTDLCDKADAANRSVTHSGAQYPTTVYAERIRAAIATEMETEQ